jgi:hypothetical protein
MYNNLTYDECDKILSQDGLIFKFFSDKMRANQKLAILAAARNINALQFADPTLMDDEGFMLKLIKFNGSALAYASERLTKNLGFLLKAATICGYSTLSCADESLRSNRSLVLAAVRQNGYALQFASYQLKTNRMIAKMAISNEIGALYLLDDSLLEDEEFIKFAYSVNEEVAKEILLRLGK